MSAANETASKRSGLLVVGRDVPRDDAQPKVTGSAQYVADMHLPNMLHAAVLRSPHAHARIVAIDASAAKALRGVKAVITGADTAARKWGAFRPDLYPLAIGKVRYVGDEVAAVAAIDPETARAAVDKIVVRYEVLPAALNDASVLDHVRMHVNNTSGVAVDHDPAFYRPGNSGDLTRILARETVANDTVICVGTSRRGLAADLAIRLERLIAGGELATLRVGKDAFFNLVTQFPQVGLGIMSELAHRLHQTTVHLTEASARLRQLEQGSGPA